MTSDEALAIWKQSGLGKTYWTFEFAQAVERKTLDSVLSILDEYEHGIDHVAKLVRELSELPQPVAQTEQDDELEALKADNASLLDSLTKESIARCELEDRLAQTERALTDEQIVEAGYMHTVEDDEPLFAFDRKELIAMVRELLTTAQPASDRSKQ